MKLKVGDKIKGLSNEYRFTNTDMYLGEVKNVYEDYIRILILKHKDSNIIGNICCAMYPGGKFEIVERKNKKFFKKLPNDFTGTIEIENGYIVEKEILDEEEKEYLSNVIRPFRDKVKYIVKETFINEEFINITIKNDSSLCFPCFEKETMYKGMEEDKEYTLEELGL